MDYKYCTKISKDVSNPGNFTGEPPQMAAQQPPAVAKYISKPLFIFLYTCLIFISIIIIVFISVDYFIDLLTFIFVVDLLTC